ncbi:AcrR family transcriptional regulator [Neisseria perflava]|uniref:TetR/AcrR family transcriptional regulator n=1 Tax=Neisseria perflava TaxID=33053 RepID=UPI00209FAEDA|nr:TetR/AcrR family transcriptional regulator [Neisseria perflava]MCP1771858.1 AcrR family transcriptional regulator [Neisseria perflava]
MTGRAHDKFIQAGLVLYPDLGYRKLSVRALAAEAGLSPGMFHHLFASKDEFMQEMLARCDYEVWGSWVVENLPQTNPFERLREVTRLFALNTRNHLKMAHRLLTDSADGVDVINRSVKQSITARTEVFLELLEACGQCDNSRPATSAQRLGYFNAAVIGPMIVGTRFQQMDLLPDSLNCEVENVLTDEAILQRIDWSLNALFPGYIPDDR